MLVDGEQVGGTTGLPEWVTLPRKVVELVTMNVYGHVSLGAKREAMDQLGRLLQEGEEPGEEGSS